MGHPRAPRPARRSALASVLVGLSLVLGFGGSAAAVDFADVPPGAAFYDDIQWLADQGITHGAVGPEGSYIFGASDNITREAMAAFIYRFRGEPPFTAPSTSPFADLTPGDAFFLEITWLEEQGIAPGQSDPGGEATFRPSDLVTRQVMAVWLFRALAAPGFTAPSTSPFVDVATDHPAYAEIAWMADTGLSTGVPVGDGTFQYVPEDPITREAMAAFLHRADALLDRTAPRGAYDLDGDGAPDILAVATSTGALWLNRGDGAGGWLSPVQVATGWSGIDVIESVGDVDGDGYPDVLAREASSGALWLYPGDGSGGFLARRQVGWGWAVMSAVVGPGDVDGDGRPDVLAREASSGAFWLYPGDGSGGWLARRQVGWGWGSYVLPGDATIRNSNPPFFVYGSLRTGQSGYYLLQNRIITSLGTRMPYLDLYRLTGSSYPYVVPNSTNASGVVGEVMVVKPSEYQGTLTTLDSYERYNPSLPPDNQTYVRELRPTREGVPSWVYVAGTRQAQYLMSSGILITSGDFLRW